MLNTMQEFTIIAKGHLDYVTQIFAFYPLQPPERNAKNVMFHCATEKFEVIVYVLG